ncbi:MAG: DNA polymerase III subunit delta [Lachnospiraceae bacterium]|nr:DNA polymerase III subunit delta [Lachnospiraceae bacterium]
MKNIKNDIKNADFKRVYLLFGKENYLKRLYADKLKKAVVPEEDSMNCTVIQGDSFDTNAFIGMCDTMPFFADRRLVLVNRCGKFKGRKKETEEKPEEEQEEAPKDSLAEYIKMIPDTTVVVFVEDEADKRSKLYKAVKEHGYACEMNQLDEKDLMLWIGTEFKALGKSITADTASYLMGWSGTDMGNLKVEIEKLGFYAMDRNSVERADIEAVCTRQLSSVVFDLTDALAEGKQGKALKVYEELIKTRQPVQLIWRMLLKHFMQLLAVKELRNKGRSSDEIASSTGIHPFAVQKMVRQIGTYKLSQIRKKIELGVQLEQDLKSGRIDEKNLVELFITQGGI